MARVTVATCTSQTLSTQKILMWKAIQQMLTTFKSRDGQDVEQLVLSLAEKTHRSDLMEESVTFELSTRLYIYT